MNDEITKLIEKRKEYHQFLKDNLPELEEEVKDYLTFPLSEPSNVYTPIPCNERKEDGE